MAFRIHKISSEKSEPYICIGGPDGGLWFCESGTSKIGRLDVNNGKISEFNLPESEAMPIGITPGASLPLTADSLARSFRIEQQSGLIVSIATRFTAAASIENNRISSILSRRKSRRLVSWAKRPWPQVLTWGYQPPRSAPPFYGLSQRLIPVVDHLHYAPTDIRPRGSDPRRNRLVSTPGGMC